VYLKEMPPEQLLVRDDETDFYGKKYWLEHQQGAFGYADIHTRARNDLTERNLHWLKTLLKYRLPPAKVLELGCAHGSFVALLRQVGYDAGGVELSPWIVEFGKKTFDVPILVGPIEALEIPPGSFDAIVLMDVLEHLPNPVETMKHCLRLLKPDGLFLIQTPQFRKEMNYAELVAGKGPFLEQLKADEHLYLFSDDSVTRFFKELGASHILFEPAIFGRYDMFFAVGRAKVRGNSNKEIESTLLENSSRRLVLALLDLRQREQDIAEHLAVSEADCLARSDQITSLSAMLKEAQTDNAERGKQIAALSKMLKESEVDRSDRGEQITALSKMLDESEADRLARSDQITSLSAMLKEAQTDNAERGKQIAALSKMLKELDADRNDRIDQIGDIHSDLRVLFARPGFRWLIKLTKWPEIRKLADKFGIRIE
jgi:2-polyprenyl-3-methyl-5-hydroxy-6-metoxy-1,4-benzoquinol methylase